MNRVQADPSMSRRRRIILSVITLTFAVSAFIGLPVLFASGVRVHYGLAIWTVIKASFFWLLFTGIYYNAKDVLIDHLREGTGLEISQTRLWLQKAITFAKCFGAISIITLIVHTVYGIVTSEDAPMRSTAGRFSTVEQNDFAARTFLLLLAPTLLAIRTAYKELHKPQVQETDDQFDAE